MALMKFGDMEESITTREELSLAQAQETLDGEVIAILGYGVQGPAQALNLRDNGFNVIVGQREGSTSWQRAVDDGWEPGKTLFPLAEACARGTFLCYLLSDAGQIQQWPTVKQHLTAGKILLFSHGFAAVYNQQTEIVPPDDVDVILVAPKGSGRSVRRLFLQQKGINSSYAVFQGVSGSAKHKALAYGIGIGSGYLFPTTFENEVHSDLTGERGVLMGAIAGLFEAQYEVLRENGHSASEAFNETVEELTQSLMPLVAEKGMDWMYSSCSTTAQRGALDWLPRFKQATLPVFKALYESVRDGSETQRVIDKNSSPDYKQELEKELQQMRDREIWKVGTVVRELRPAE